MHAARFAAGHKDVFPEMDFVRQNPMPDKDMDKSEFVGITKKSLQENDKPNE